GAEPVAEPAIETNGKHDIDLEPAVVETAFEGFEAVGPVVEQGEMPAAAVAEPVTQPEWFAPEPELPRVEEMPEPAVAQAPEITIPETEPVIEPVFAHTEEISVPEIEPVIEPVFAQAEATAEPEFEPVGQGQPIPQLTPVEEPSIIEVTEPEPAVIEALRQPSEPVIEPVFESRIYEPTKPVTMPEPAQIPPAPAMRGGAPQPGAMQTAVQLTFAFEIASMQLTPTFKMGALQLRPASKFVTMRLAGTSPQPAMNLQVTCQIARIQPAGGTLGSVRLTPSQQQRPSVVGSPS